MAALFAALPGRIGVVVASRRYGGKYGGFWRQTFRNLRRSGRAFVDYLGLNPRVDRNRIGIHSFPLR